MAIEFAMVAPIFFSLIFACIEFTRVHTIQAAVENACFEGARRGIVPGAATHVCKATTESLLDVLIKDFTVTVTPSTIDVTTDEVTVTASVPLNAGNGFGLTGLFQESSLTKSITMKRED
ncbi:MAG: TadE/TadG family type IV pilus assembly protein [Mariniblastus sp.]